MQAKEVQTVIDEKKKRVSVIEKQLVVAGQRAYGDKYMSRLIKSNTAGDMKITISNAKVILVDLYYNFYL